MRRSTTTALGLGIALSAAGFATTPANAGLYPYATQLMARASIGAGASTFNLPSGSAFSSATPDINNNRSVVFKTTVTGGTGSNGIWYGMADPNSQFGSGGMVYAPTQDWFLSDPTLNNNNVAVFPQTFSSANGIYRYDAATNTTTLHTAGPLGASSWSNPRINDIGQVGARVSFTGGNAYVSYDVNPSQTAVHATERSIDPNSPYSFLSTSNFDNSRRIAGRLNVGATFNNANPDEIRIFNADGSSILIANDRDADPASPFFQFDNTGPGMNDNGWVAFIARTTTAAASRSVFLSNGTETITIATPGSGLTSIDNFSPSVNNLNQVVFRATDLNGNISVFVGDGTTLQRVVGIGDPMETDIGTFNINSLGGNPTINDLGDIAFGGGLGAGGNFIAVALIPEPASVAVLSLAGAALLLRRRRGT